jgi:carbon monoxide dehydrogenase subunit G
LAESLGEARCDVQPDVAWLFIRNLDNWIREFQGYDDHTVEADGSILLQMRGKMGFMTKVTRLRIVITEEQPPSRLSFSMTGVTDALDGGGELHITPTEGGTSIISYRVTLSGRGIAAPVLNEFLNFVVPDAIGDLAARIAERLTPEAAGA